MNINHVTFASREPMRQAGPRDRRAWGDQCARALSSAAITSTCGTMSDQSRARFKKMHPAKMPGAQSLSIIDQAET
ncbi:hypothetical protein AB7008_17980 [Bradyrhizobium sp. 521_C7_N1_3]|uniref:hypothetical protein n=1 Tax=Bradyrhizobium TaxID=374 RepID=UPI0027147643|nr:hypothetical protein [Bradyrhizobium japonicum]WLB51535.1 hypothetical protein QIH94_29760 [Bradyrhizobium japonicum]WLB66694.1 hypothetical protein QIH96_16560 [Bradyrhizobium japonicum]